MKVLVIALDGQIREALANQCAKRARDFEVADKQWLDTLGSDCESAKLPSIPDDITVVINAFSLECLELQPDNPVVTEQVVSLAKTCERAGVPLIHLSNSQVFDGIDGGRHREGDTPRPASRLGGRLLSIEGRVAENCSRFVILRTGPIFSHVGNTMLTSLLASFQPGKRLKFSAHGQSCPLHCDDLARVVVAIIEQLDCGASPWGIYHYCSSDPVSSFDFAEVILTVASQYLELDESPIKLEAVNTADTDWPRPLLNCEKILNTFGIKQLPWRSFVTASVKTFFKIKTVSVNE